MTSYPCNKYEQITPSYLLSVKYYVMYDLRECFDYRKIYKDCHGYHGRGVYNQEGEIFYESDKRPGICRICSSALGSD